MKRTILIGSFICVVFGITSLAQGESKAVLVDEFGRLYCDDFEARLQNLFVTLASNPGNHAYVVIYGGKTGVPNHLIYERWLWGEVKALNFDPSYLTEIRGDESGDVKIQFWMVPLSTSPLNFNEGAWNFSLNDLSKPRLMYAESNDLLCSSGNFERIFSDYLAANPRMMGRIVIFSKTMKGFLRKRQEIVEKLEANAVRRTHFVRKIIRLERDSDTQWWLLPADRK